MIKKIFSLLFLLMIFTLNVQAREGFFKVQSIDTMKFSRDDARSKLNDPGFDKEIDIQVKNIADTGATHIAIGTPYDEEFFPFLKRWVDTARKYKLNVWYRSNWSGWEGWFDYPKNVTRNSHIEKTRNFIINHPDIFVDGDIFVSCPECENGGPGDPRVNRDINEYRKFLIEEYQATKLAFQQINKKIISNYFSMNGDVAALIMDKNTTQALDGAITIDHYVLNGDKLVKDIKNNYSKFNNQVILGEFGVPIPDINGNMTDQEQAKWIDDSLKKIIKLPQVVAINYWTNKGSSTALWDDNNQSKLAVSIINNYYNPINVFGIIRDNNGKTIDGAIVKSKNRQTISKNGNYILPILDNESVFFSKKGYISLSITLTEKNIHDIERNITMESANQPFVYTVFQRLIYFLRKFFNQ